MHTSDFMIPFPAVELKQALTDIIESIALTNTAFSHMLSAESGMLEKAKKDADDIDEFVSVNASVNSIVRSIVTLQLFNNYELEDAENLLQKIADLYEYEDTEE